MGDPGAGFEYPPLEVSWLKRYVSEFSIKKRGEQLTLASDSLLFANSIGCTVDELHFLYACIRGSFHRQLLTSSGTPSFVSDLPHIRYNTPYDNVHDHDFSPD